MPSTPADPLPFDAVLFDCDGVLVDSEPITKGVLRSMLVELGWDVDPGECVRLFVGKALKDELSLIEEHTGVRPDEAWLQDFRTRRNAALERDLVEVPGASAAVRAIAAAYDGRIACASGADLHKVRLQLTKTGLLDAFGGSLFSGMDTPRSKPAPDVYLAAAAGLGVDPARCAVVEDTVTGVRAGVAAGATVVGFGPGGPAHTPAAALLAAGASTVITRMQELPALVRMAGASRMGHGGAMSEQDEHRRDEHSQDARENGTAEPRSLRVEGDQEQPEDATYAGGDQDRAQPVPDQSA
ncbi:MAG: HAD family phosphatase [Nocardioides sp.]|nr:HAD family phosphatase [Nocardioides sp.]